VFSDKQEDETMRETKTHRFVTEEDLLQAIDSFEKNKNLEKLFVIGNSEKILSLFTFIEAAGGLVKKESGEILFIFRYGKWDLPKGKCEPNETPAETAIREVTEETGVTGLIILKEYIPTFHTYKIDGRRVIKKTWWFEMTYGDDSKILPQKIEDITIVKWLAQKDIPWAMRDSYASVIELLTATGHL
jgi:8-oxo-dGTP pyrophosphatase MutT (NUDIX family)